MKSRNPLWSLEGGVFLTGNRITGDVKVDEYGVQVHFVHGFEAVLH